MGRGGEHRRTAGGTSVPLPASPDNPAPRTLLHLRANPRRWGTGGGGGTRSGLSSGAEEVSRVRNAALLAGASCLCYGRSLQGEFVHDDVWAIVNNPDVRPGAPLRWGIFSNDFWGKGMAENTSHKSYRPLCVLTFNALSGAVPEVPAGECGMELSLESALSVAFP
ncbi:protein O-mannosyl-transferase TMTC1-like [Rhinolophus ferrumequinum]|uniref:protein O-mannosyl-transferase TMTC1-like n=1 Tax=Rhinolophus ferrumequinum TaxID=59479 RepID=UPI00140F52C6|nr:protein O-mannosyl-transferase TMTC1-like [Rhinolophus ferrumequinum]